MTVCSPVRHSGVRGFGRDALTPDLLDPVHPLKHMPRIAAPAIRGTARSPDRPARPAGQPRRDTGQELPRRDVHRGDGGRLGHWQVTFEVDATARLVPGLAGRPAGPILGGVALLDMTPGNLRLGQSQQLAVHGLELGCLGAARRLIGSEGALEMRTRLVNPFIS